MNIPILQIQELTTGYVSGGRRHIVGQRLTAALSPGSFTALIGTNGAGKSTLLRTLAGLQPPLEGQVVWLGKAVNDYSRQELARTLAVVLTQRLAGEGLSVADVVEMGRIPYTGIRGQLGEKDCELVAQAMEVTGVTGFAHRRVSSLSDGERQRVMIAKALAQETPVILLDEPTAFLDYPSKVLLFRLLRRLASEHHKTVIMTTHDLELTFQLAGQLWLLSPEGLAEGSPADLAATGQLEQFFAGEGLRFDRQHLRFDIAP